MYAIASNAVVTRASAASSRATARETTPASSTRTERASLFPEKGKKRSTRTAVASLDEGDLRVTMLSWSSAAERLRFVNHAIEAFLEDASNACEMVRDDEKCVRAVENVMAVLVNAGDEAEAVRALREVLAKAGPAAGAAVEAWCWRHAGTDFEPRARVFAHHAASFDIAAERSDRRFANDAATASCVRDVSEACPGFHGADEQCSETVDAALLMTVCSYVDLQEALAVVDAIVDAGGDAAVRAVKAWCSANPGAAHVDRIVQKMETRERTRRGDRVTF